MSHAKPLHWIRPALLGLAFSGVPSLLAADTDCTEEGTGGGSARHRIDVGSITVCNDGENLYIRLTAVNGWLMTGTHLAIAPAGDEKPHDNERPPKIGRFPRQRSYVPAIAEDIYVIPLRDAGLVPERRLAIAAHITAHNAEHPRDVLGQRKQTEYAGASSEAPAGRSWASYFRYTLQAHPSGPVVDGGGI